MAVLAAGSVGSAQTPPVVAIAAGVAHAAALTADGRVWTWGQNDVHQLGNGGTRPRTQPAPVPGLDGVRALASGAYAHHTVVLTDDERVLAWGGGQGVLLAFGPRPPVPAPSPIEGVGAAVEIAANGQVSVAVDPQGRVRRWGGPAAAPAWVDGLPAVRAVALGAVHDLALDTEGRVWSWGNDAHGALGRGADAVSFGPPGVVPGLDDVVAVAAGGSFSLALGGDGRVWAWGRNDFGTLGDGTTTSRSVPGVVPGLTSVVAIAAGADRAYAVRADGSVWTWGAAYAAETSPPAMLTSPTRVAGVEGAVAVAAGLGYALALDADGAVWGWGRNEAGTLGDGTTVDRATPVRVTRLGPPPSREGRLATAAGRAGLAGAIVLAVLLFAVATRARRRRDALATRARRTR